MKLPNYKKQMYEFFKELNKIYPTKDKRHIVLLLGVYGEYLVNELLRINFPESRLDEINSQKIKLDILRATEFLSSEEYSVFSLLNNVRNKYAHNLYVNEKEMEDSMKKIKINFATDEKTIKEFDKQMNKIPFTKFQSECIARIVFLFQRLGEFLPKQN